MKFKICTKCNIKKSIINFCLNNNANDKLFSWCKKCTSNQRKHWYKKDIFVRPWINSYNNAKQRCNNPKNPNFYAYGAIGIKFLLTKSECAALWKRDSANLLKWASIDRIDNKGNYTLANCQFIEIGENSQKDKTYFQIGQYTKNNTLIKIWKSQGEAARTLNISQADISNCIHGIKCRTVKGFIWKNIL